MANSCLRVCNHYAVKTAPDAMFFSLTCSELFECCPWWSAGELLQINQCQKGTGSKISICKYDNLCIPFILHITSNIQLINVYDSGCTMNISKNPWLKHCRAGAVAHKTDKLLIHITAVVYMSSFIVGFNFLVPFPAELAAMWVWVTYVEWDDSVH